MASPPPGLGAVATAIRNDIYDPPRWVVTDAERCLIGTLGDDTVENTRDRVERLLATSKYINAATVVIEGDMVVAYGPASTDSADGVTSPSPSADQTPPPVGERADQVPDGSATSGGAAARGAASPDADQQSPASPARGIWGVIARLVGDGLSSPMEIEVGYYSDEVKIRVETDRPEYIADWARALDIGPHVYSKVRSSSPHDHYRTGWAAGHSNVLDMVVEVRGWVAITADPSGLEGSGWFDPAWIATTRKGIAAHRPTDGRDPDATFGRPGAALTACGRSMRTGIRMTAAQAARDHGATFGCRRCWPDGSPITTPGDAS
jgi:hypothetical protein